MIRLISIEKTKSESKKKIDRIIWKGNRFVYFLFKAFGIVVGLWSAIGMKDSMRTNKGIQ